MTTPVGADIQTNQSIAIDAKSLGNLKAAAKKNSPEALNQAAKQFEALFLNMVLKSMRDATPTNVNETSSDRKLFTSMFDQQMSQVMAQRGVGLADMMIRQLQNAASFNQIDPKLMEIKEKGAPEPMPLNVPKTFELNKSPQSGFNLSNVTGKVKEFIEPLLSQAKEASQKTGLPPQFILGQAALESGWGKRQILNQDGSTSHNIFGIKANSSWKGKTTEILTTEYINGKPEKVMATFRSYDSYADAFSDYANLISTSPRYKNLIETGQTLLGFVQGLKKAGYATDTAYAEKLSNLIRTNFKA
jgi:flagellar protein FlgJ